jgi:DNA-binding response OmpR family regulator
VNILYASDGPTDDWLVTGLRQARHSVTVVIGLPETLLKLPARRPDAVLLDRVPEPGVWLRSVAASAVSAGRVVLLDLVDSAQPSQVLQAGADACLRRPLEFSELAACLEALQARLEPPRAPASILLLPESRAAKVDGVEVSLTTLEYQLLSHMLREPARPLPTSQLCRLLWDDEQGASAEALKLLVHRLRTKLRRSTGKSLIRNHPRLGYSLESCTKAFLNNI